MHKCIRGYLETTRWGGSGEGGGLLSDFREKLAGGGGGAFDFFSDYFTEFELNNRTFASLVAFFVNKIH